MKLRRIIALTAAVTVAAACMGSCKKKNKEPDKSSSETASSTSVSPDEVDTYPDYPISYPEIEKKDMGDIYEAEDAKLSDGLKIVSNPKEEETTSSDKKNDKEKTTEQPATKFDPTVRQETVHQKYSGTGYVTGFKSDGSTTAAFTVNAPSNQHYDLSFSIASDRKVNCRITLNGTEISTFKTMNDGDFTLITLYGVFLVKGKSEIVIRPENGDLCLDYLKVSNNTSLSDIKYDANNKLANKEAGKQAKELMDFLTENYGKYTLTGQYASSPENKELDLIYKTTGKYPVVRLSAMHTTGNTFDSSFQDVDACADWYRKGGVVGLMWYWEAPSKKPSVYAKETDFKLKDAMTDIDIAEMTQEEIRGLYGEGKISEQCYGLVRDLDNMAGQLTSLKNKGVPVLWRPLHEGSGDWFWWGASGVDAYKWLWDLMYRRYTNYFELDNLIWIWNGQSEETLVSKNTFDIASLDIYLDNKTDYGSRYEQFLALQNIVGKEKLIALSECSSVPDIDSSFRDNAVWSFFGLWYGKYLENEDGEFSGEYTDKETLVRAYNSDGALSLDEYQTLRSGKKLVSDYGTGTTTSATSTTSTSSETPADTSGDTTTETTAVSST